MLDTLDPTREVPPARDAATVLVVRDGADRLEVFCVERHARSGFMGGALVFPGGKVDVADADPAWRAVSTGAAERGVLLAGQSGPDPLTLAVAACRELLEEAALLPVRGGSLGDDELRALRDALRSRASLPDELARRSLLLDTGALVPFGRWVTPEAESRRFDARFYVLEAPRGQAGLHDGHETTTSFWAPPDDVLERSVRGEVLLAPPTVRCLEILSGATSTGDALARAAQQSLLPICPLFVPDAEAPYLALPGDPRHPIDERRIDGPTRFVLRDGRFVSEQPPLYAR